MRTVKIFIRGTVQGVSFRNYLKKRAEELDLKGFARNMDDGRVEVVIEGRDENIDKMVEECKKGPAHSDVQEVVSEDMKHQGFDSFKVLSM